MTIGAIINELEKFASPHLQESWDNTGLQVGNRRVDCTGVLVCVDCTPAVVDEAISRGCNLIVSHHPLIFKGLKHLTGSTPVETAVMNAIAAGISIYSSHTALDSTAPGGVSREMAARLGVTPIKVLSPLSDKLVCLDVIVPTTHAEDIRIALLESGAGAIGNYDACSFTVNGTGRFRPLEGANPNIGDIGAVTAVDECMVRAVLPRWRMKAVEQAMIEAHPYEVPAYTFTPMLNDMPDVGLGIYGTIDNPADGISAMQLIERVKKAFNSPTVRTTGLPESDVKIKRVAMCGGAGGEFIPRAIAAGAQAYITSDVRYHDFVDYRDAILIIDIGHFESEQCTKDIFFNIISQLADEKINKKIANFAVYKSETEKNSINYI